MTTLQRREGFAGQDMFVIPRPKLSQNLRHPLFRSVYPTDIGWFPNAAYHYRERPDGARQDHLMVCVDGHGFAEIAGQRAHLRAGEILVIPRHTRHAYWAAEDAPWSIYWMHFLGDDADYYLERIPRPGHPIQVDATSRAEAVRLFQGCLGALHDGYTPSTLIYAAQAAGHILSLLLYRNKALPYDPSARRGHADLDEVVQFMRSHLKRPLRLEDFARKAGLSVSHFSERFRAQTGHSPMAYFIALRMRLACRLLDLTDKPVKAVAMETGYRDPYYFSRLFKKTMGISPEKYRGIKKG